MHNISTEAKKYNFHSHTRYSDGKQLPEAYILRAIELGMHAYGIADHSPLKQRLPWCIPYKKLDEYIETLLALKAKYEGVIDVFLSLEIDFIPGISDVSKYKGYPLDYTIGSVHIIDTYPNGKPFDIAGNKDGFENGLRQIFDNDIKKAATRYFELNIEMLETHPPDIIAHSDLIKFQNKGRFAEADCWYQRLTDMLLLSIKHSDTILEINTRGFYKGRTEGLFPSDAMIRKAVEMDIPLMLASDAHTLDEIHGGFDYSLELLPKLGVRELTVFGKNGFEQIVI